MARTRSPRRVVVPGWGGGLFQPCHRCNVFVPVALGMLGCIASASPRVSRSTWVLQRGRSAVSMRTHCLRISIFISTSADTHVRSNTSIKALWNGHLMADAHLLFVTQPTSSSSLLRSWPGCRRRCRSARADACAPARAELHMLAVQRAARTDWSTHIPIVLPSSSSARPQGRTGHGLLGCVADLIESALHPFGRHMKSIWASSCLSAETTAGFCRFSTAICPMRGPGL